MIGSKCLGWAGLTAVAIVAVFVGGCARQKPVSVSEAKPVAVSTSQSVQPVSNVISPPASKQPDWEFEWTKDSGTRVSGGGVPYIYKLKDGKFRLYYCVKEGIVSAVSSDGLNFEKEAGVRIAQVSGFGNHESMVCDPTIVDLPDGTIRMYYKGATGAGGPGKAVHEVFSAVSSDGLNFQKEGLRIDSKKTGDDGWASVPEAVRLSDGRVRIYYVSDAASVGHGIVSAISSDGLNFTKEETKLTGFVDPAVIILSDGQYLLLAKSFMGKGIYSFVSNDGIDFENQRLVLAEESYDPSIIQLDNDTYRVFYGGQEPVTRSITGRL